MNNKILFVAFGIAVVLLLAGCDGGGGGNTGSSTNEGTFVDSVVEGLSYETASQFGTTDSNGTFEYQDEETVSFSIGDIVLGSGVGAETMTPVELVSGATDETDPTVTNLCIFIISLDVDGDPSNGIEISSVIRDVATGVSLDFDQATADFLTDPALLDFFSELNLLSAFSTDGVRQPCGAEYAQGHLHNTLNGESSLSMQEMETVDAVGKYFSGAEEDTPEEMMEALVNIPNVDSASCSNSSCIYTLSTGVKRIYIPYRPEYPAFWETSEEEQSALQAD